MPGHVVGVFRDWLNKHLSGTSSASCPGQKGKWNDLLQSLPAGHCVILEWVDTGWEEPCILWCWRVREWLSHLPPNEWSITLCGIWQSHSPYVLSEAFLKPVRPPELSPVGEMQHEVHPLCRWQGTGALRLYMWRFSDKRCPGAVGKKKPLAIVSHCHWFEHFSRTGLVKGLCWWIGSQQWGAGKVLVLCNCPSRGVAQLLHASAHSFVVLVLMKTQEGTSF